MTTYLPDDLIGCFRERLPAVGAFRKFPPVTGEVAKEALRQTETLYVRYFWQPAVVKDTVSGRMTRMLSSLRRSGSELAHAIMYEVRALLGGGLVASIDGLGGAAGGGADNAQDIPIRPDRGSGSLDKGALLSREVEYALRQVEKSKSAQGELDLLVTSIVEKMDEASRPGANVVFNQRIIVNVIHDQVKKAEPRWKKLAKGARDALIVLAAVSGIFAGALMAEDRFFPSENNAFASEQSEGSSLQDEPSGGKKAPAAADGQTSEACVSGKNSAEDAKKAGQARFSAGEFAFVKVPIGVNVRARPTEFSDDMGGIAYGQRVQVLEPGLDYTKVIGTDPSGNIIEGYVIDRGLTVERP